VLVHAVPYPAVFGKHVSDGQGTVFAIVDRRPYTSGVTPHLVMISGGVATTLYSVSPSGTLGDLTASFAPCAPTAATGSVGASAGGPFDVLVVNGSAGSAFRRVSIPRAQSFQVAVATPPTGGPALFAVVGMIGVPDPKDGLAGPAGFGRLILTPCPLAPADPFLFTLVDGFGIGGSPPILQATPTPWSVTLPGLDLDFSFTIQGVIQDVTATPFAVSATNAIRIDIE
jgi:hypothetical protein